MTEDETRRATGQDRNRRRLVTLAGSVAALGAVAAVVAGPAAAVASGSGQEVSAARSAESAQPAAGLFWL